MLIKCSSWRTIVAGIGLAVLTACASPPTRFYTLGIDGESTISDRTSSPAFLIDMRPVKVPAAVAKSQLVVQVSVTQVKVLEDDRWASPLADEIRNALLGGVTRQVGALDGRAAVLTEDVPVYQVSVDVQRFESWLGSHVFIDVVWSVRKSNDTQTLTCHSVVSQPVSAGYDPIVEGHRRALRRIGTQIAEAVQEFPVTSTSRPLRLVGTSARPGKGTLSCPTLADGGAKGTNDPVLDSAQ
jgi:uncharacterized lipoprotein YmbA